MVKIRQAVPADYDFILRLNAANVEVLSPMDKAQLTDFVQNAETVLVAEVNGNQAAFLIAIREGYKSYTSENYRWFSNHYSQFLYVDRIVLDKGYRGHGLGRRLYEEVFRLAADTGVQSVAAEIDTVPYNETSLKFHERMGFVEVGTQWIRNNSIKVSLQERRIT